MNRYITYFFVLFIFLGCVNNKGNIENNTKIQNLLKETNSREVIIEYEFTGSYKQINVIFDSPSVKNNDYRVFCDSVIFLVNKIFGIDSTVNAYELSFVENSTSNDFTISLEEVYSILATKHINNKEYNLAIFYLDKSIKIAEKKVFYFNRAYCFFMKGDYSKSILDLESFYILNNNKHSKKELILMAKNYKELEDKTNNFWYVTKLINEYPKTNIDDLILKD